MKAREVGLVQSHLSGWAKGQQWNEQENREKRETILSSVLIKIRTHKHKYRSVRLQHALHTLLLRYPPVAVIEWHGLAFRCYKLMFDAAAQCVCMCERVCVLAEEQ